MNVIKDMICRVESEHVAKLEQLNAVQQEQRQGFCFPLTSLLATYKLSLMPTIEECNAAMVTTHAF